MKITLRIAAVLLLLLTYGCRQGNENWVIVDETQPGVYVAGEATVYSKAAPASKLQPLTGQLDPDGTEVPTDILYIDTWLYGGKEYQIVMSDGKALTTYGLGDEKTSGKDIKVYALAPDKSASVAEDGLYRLMVNTTTKDLHVIKMNWGIIGSATENGWDAETPLPNCTFDEKTYTVTTSARVALTASEYKFRYSGGWGYTFSGSDGKELKFHTNLGLAQAGSLSHKGDYSEGKPGGENISSAYAGEFEVRVSYEISSRIYRLSAKLVGEPAPQPKVTLPEQLYMIGYAGWDWNANAIELIPVNGQVGPTANEGKAMYWTLKYFDETTPAKFNFLKAWDGKEMGFAAVSDEAKDLAGVQDDGGNIKVTKPGWYLVLATVKASADGSALETSINFLTPNVILMSPTSDDGWNTNPENVFKVPEKKDGVFVSPAFGKDGELRMGISLDGFELWKTEFIIRDGKIDFRGNGGDQHPRVQVTKGQRAYLNFTDNTGEIK